MPIYEFQCPHCAHSFEELCSMGTSSVKCPQCGSDETRRRVSAFGIGKGSGSASTSASSSGSKCGSCHSGHCHTCH